MTIIPFSTAKTRDTACAVTALETLIERYKEHIELSQDELLSTCPFGYPTNISHLMHLCYVGIVEGFIYNLESRVVELVEGFLSVQHFESLVEFHRQCNELDNAPYATAQRSFWLGDTITTITFVQIDSVSRVHHVCIGTSNLWNWVVDILVSKVKPNTTGEEKDHIFYSPDFYTRYTDGNFGETPVTKITPLRKSNQRVYPLNDYLYSDVAVTKVGEHDYIIFNEYQHQADDVIPVRLKLGEFEEYMGKYTIIPTEAIAQIAMIRGWLGMCTKYPNGFLVRVKTLSFIDGKKHHVIHAGRTEEGKYQRSYFTTDGELFVDELVKLLPSHNVMLSCIDNIDVNGDATTPAVDENPTDFESVRKAFGASLIPANNTKAPTLQEVESDKPNPTSDSVTHGVVHSAPTFDNGDKLDSPPDNKPQQGHDFSLISYVCGKLEVVQNQRISFVEYRADLGGKVDLHLTPTDFLIYMRKYLNNYFNNNWQVGLINWNVRCMRHPNDFMVRITTLNQGYSHVIQADQDKNGLYHKTIFVEDNDALINAIIDTLPSNNVKHTYLFKTADADVEEVEVKSEQPIETLTTRTILSQLFKSVGDAFILAGKQLADKDQL